MDQQFDDRLVRQLGTIEARGQRHLAATARLAGRAAAAGHAMRAAIIVPGLALLAVPVARIDPVLLLAAALLVPLLVFAVVRAVAQWRHTTGRQAALAVLDRRLGLKDRVLASDEFLASADRDGFRQAALEEAQPWLARAASDAIACDTVVVAPSRRDRAYLSAAILLCTLVLLIQHVRQAPPQTGGAIGAARSVLAAAGIRPVPVDTPGDDAAGDVKTGDKGASDRGGAGNGAGAAGRTASGRAPQADSRAGSAGTARAGSASDPAARTGKASAGRAPSSAPDPSAPPGGKGLAGDDAAKADARTATAKTSDGQSNTTAAATPSSAPSADRRTGGSPAAPRAGAAPAPRAAAQPGNGARPNSPKRPSNGQQPGQTAGQSGGQKGGQGSGTAAGTDAIKRARGMSALLLAVPMDDRLVGTLNAGRVSSTGQAAKPQASSAARVPAQARGTQRGDAGRVFHRPSTLHDDRLLGAFFRRDRTGEPMAR